MEAVVSYTWVMNVGSGAATIRVSSGGWVTPELTAFSSFIIIIYNFISFIIIYGSFESLKLYRSDLKWLKKVKKGSKKVIFRVFPFCRIYAHQKSKFGIFVIFSLFFTFFTFFHFFSLLWSKKVIYDTINGHLWGGSEKGHFWLKTNSAPRLSVFILLKKSYPVLAYDFSYLGKKKGG